MPLLPTLRTQIAKQMEEARDGSRLVSSMQGILQMLKSHNLAWDQVIVPAQVGVHSSNRDGLGLSSSEVRSLIDDVLAVGFSKSEVKGIALELVPGDQTCKMFNKALAESSAGSLAMLDPSAIRFASVAGSHLNAGLNCWLQGVVHNGQRLSLAHLSEVDHEYWSACTNGTSWTVVSYEIEQAFPDFPVLLQSSCNVGNHLSRTESEVQLLRKIFVAVTAHGHGGHVSWKNVSKQVLGSKPTLGSTCPMLFPFVVKFSGGVSGHLLADTETFVSSFGFARRAVGGEVYEALSSDFKGTEQYARYRHCNLFYSLAFSCFKN